MKLLLELFLVFAKVGMFSFGGGYVMFMMFTEELAKKRKWVSEKDLMDYYAIGVCTPGIIAVNVATFAGYKVKGKLGGIVATLGMIVPSIVLVTLVCLLLKEFMHNAYVISALNGIKVGVVALLAVFVWDLAKKHMRTWWSYVIFAISLALLVWCKLHMIFIIIFAGAMGYSFNLLKKKKGHRK